MIAPRAPPACHDDVVLPVLATVAVIVAVSAVIGQAAWMAAGRTEWSYLAPATGFAALMVLAGATIRLPGHASAARVAIAAAVCLALVVIYRRRPSSAGVNEAAVAGLVALFAASLPFLFNGRVGILGVLDNADFMGHLVLADALGTGADASTSPFAGGGYPTGPHALAAAFTAFGSDVQTSFTAVLVAVPMLSAIAALSALGGLSRPWRVAAATLVGLPYLAAAYLVQASFKEPIQALLALAFVLALRRLHRDGSLSARGAIPLGLLAAGCFSNYSFAGLAWPVAIFLCWLAAAIVAGRRLPSRAVVRAVGIATAVATAIVALAVIPELGDNFVAEIGAVEEGETTGGNIGASIRSFEAIGLWFSGDFRSHPNPFYAGMVAALGVAAVVYGSIWWLWRRDVAVPAGIAACFVIYFYARQFATPYYDAKALVIVAPLLTLLIVRALAANLLSARALAGWRSATPLALGRVALAVVVFAAAAWSTVLVTRAARVNPTEHASELARFRPLTEGRPTLFMGQDDYALWELRGARLAVPISYVGSSDVRFSFRSDLGFTPGAPVDFDFLDQGNLDRFDYVVASRTAYASVPPANWRRRSATQSYVLWERRGPTVNREVLSAPAPGAELDCRQRASRRLARRNGRASVRPDPVLTGGASWTLDGQAAPTDGSGAAVIAPGQTAVQALRLPPGRWDISLQYLSTTPVQISGLGLKATLPPVQERVGPYWSAGTVISTGRVSLTAKVESPPRLARDRAATLVALAATRVDAPPAQVPLRRACGRYVDFFQLDDDEGGVPAA